MVPNRFTIDAEAQGCLCFVEKVARGWQKHYPDACPLHGWRPEPTPERLAQCKREKESFRKDTDDFMKFIAAAK